MFRNIKKEKELIDREVKLYREEKFLEIEKSIETYRADRNREMEDIAKRCAKELGSHEHNYHHTLELRGIENAKLEAKKETLTEIVEANKKLMDAKDAEIKRLYDLLSMLIVKQPSTIIQQHK